MFFIALPMKYSVGYNLKPLILRQKDLARSHLQSPDLNNLKDKQKLSRLASKIEIILLKLMHLGHIDIITRNLKFNILNDQ